MQWNSFDIQHAMNDNIELPDFMAVLETNVFKL